MAGPVARAWRRLVESKVWTPMVLLGKPRSRSAQQRLDTQRLWLCAELHRRGAAGRAVSAVAMRDLLLQVRASRRRSLIAVATHAADAPQTKVPALQSHKRGATPGVQPAPDGAHRPWPRCAPRGGRTCPRSYCRRNPIVGVAALLPPLPHRRISRPLGCWTAARRRLTDTSSMWSSS